MNSGKAILAYFIGIVVFILGSLISIILTTLLIGVFPALGNLFSLSFGDFLFVIATYGIGIYLCIVTVDKLSIKWDFEPSGVATAVGVTIIAFQVIFAIVNLVNDSSIYNNIIGIFAGIGLIFWSNE